MASDFTKSDELVRQAAGGDEHAQQQLYEQYRSRLKRMVAVRLDRRVAKRVDPSDVVQEVLGEAARLLPAYVREKPLPFYPWLRQIGISKIREAYRRHVQAAARCINRDQSLPLPDHSAMSLASRLVASGTSPTQNLLRQEQKQKVRDALMQLDELDREILVLRFLEQLSAAETAEIVGLTMPGVRSRQRRALRRFIQLFDESGELR